jgi:hypothetical protein
VQLLLQQSALPVHALKRPRQQLPLVGLHWTLKAPPGWQQGAALPPMHGVPSGTQAHTLPVQAPLQQVLALAQAIPVPEQQPHEPLVQVAVIVQLVAQFEHRPPAMPH